MAHRPLVLTLAAGAALTIASIGCNGSTKSTSVAPEGSGRTENPPEPVPDQEPVQDISENPPPPEPPPPIINKNPPAQLPEGPDDRVRRKIASPDPTLPSWGEVKSPHPEGATNPPSPALVVNPEGECFVVWEGGMIQGPGDRVEAVTADAAHTAIQCPERATTVFDKWVADGKPDPTKTGFNP